MILLIAAISTIIASDNIVLKITLTCIVGITIAVWITIIVKRNKTKSTRIQVNAEYSKKQLLTTTEVLFYKKLQNVAKALNLEVIPQINLASIINKENKGYQTELFRNVDFGLFDDNYNVVLLIELNDKTHLSNNRQERDSKVNLICEKAGIKILTFWVMTDNNENEIRTSIINAINEQEQQKKIA